MHTILLSMFIGALLGGGMAIAQSSTEKAPEHKPSRHLARFDEQFRVADKDDDGALTKSEAESGSMNRIVDNFDRLDANKDGKVTREEIRLLIRSRLSS